MQIVPHKVVTLDYTLTDDDGSILDKSQGGQFVYLHGANNIIPGLEEALTDKSAGDKFTVMISPDKAYGQRNDDMIQIVDKSMFENAEDITEGQQFHAQSSDDQLIMVTVVSVDDENVTVDGNHPMAGKNLNFDVSVLDVRDASEEEISHGHVHGPDAHTHD